jgi:Leucine-rich repeat (LRR) protein
MKSLSKSHHLLASFNFKKSRSNLFWNSWELSAFKIGDFALVEINFSYLRNTGSIPTEFGKLARMTHLDLGFNLLTGTLLLGYLSRQYEQGTVVSASLIKQQFGTRVGSANHSVRVCNLLEKRRDKKGPIPTEIGKLVNMTYIDLGFNDLTGTCAVLLLLFVSIDSF